MTASTAAARPLIRARRRSYRPVRRTIVTVLTLALVAVELYPLFWLFSSSLKTQNEFLGGDPFALPTAPDWQNYVDAIVGANFLHYVLNSLLATAPSLFLVLVLGTAAGFALEVMVFRGRGAILLVFLAGIMIPGQMILLPLFAAYFQAGLTGTLWPLIITYTATGLPLTVFMMATFFRAVPREVFEASTIDGAGMLRSFVLVGIPMVRNGVFTVALVQFFFIWNDLLVAITFTNSSELGTIQVGLLNFSGQYGATAYGPLLAAISLNVAGLLIVYLALNQRIMRGLAAGSVKG